MLLFRNFESIPQLEVVNPVKTHWFETFTSDFKYLSALESDMKRSVLEFPMSWEFLRLFHSS